MTTMPHLRLTPLALMLALASGSATAGTKTYTLDADFELGTLIGLNHSAPNANQLQLNVTGTSFPVLWIANAGEDTLSKIDSKQQGGSPGREVARYRTWFNSGAHAHDAWSGPAPSRTAVDKDGNAYVLNRWFGGHPTVLKILNNSSVDRNGNGVVDTSTDTNADGKIQTAEMLPLVDDNANGLIDNSELRDERVAWARRVPDGSYANGITRSNGIGRALCIGTDGHLWVGLYNNAEYFKISSVDGSTLAGPVSTNGRPNYGCLIDANGTLWGANWDQATLTRIANTGSNSGPHIVRTIPMPSAVYGLALRRDASNRTRVIMGGSCNSYIEHVDDGSDNWVRPAAANYCSYAVGTDNDGNILVSKRDGGVVKFDATGGVLWDKVSQVGSADSRGVIADSENAIWQVHRATHNMAKYAGSSGDFLGVIGVGYEPYTYSDASGTAALSITTKTGSWTVDHDGGVNGSAWGRVSWSALMPSGTSLAAEVRSADDKAQLAGKPFQAVTSGSAFTGQSGRYLQVKMTFNANPQNQSPVLYDMTVTGAALGRCDADMDGDIDQNDLSLISRSRGTPASGPNDPRDGDGDGRITPNDVKACLRKCTASSCAVR
ncbi:MAG: hypothetical protein IV097_18425 [Burkholderiaceae bacterium]|nr:hypothetical protein [Burkholderiaceae bacterium]